MYRISLLVLLMVFLQAEAARAGDEPVARTNALVKAFMDVRQAPEGQKLSSQDLKHNAEAYLVLDGFFAFERFTEATARPHRGKFSDVQHAEYKKLFREVIRLVAYPGSGAFFREARFTTKPGRKAGERIDVEMNATLEKEDFETSMAFHWLPVDGALRIVDVSFEGASLVDDYRSQFGRIIAKEGVEGLLKRLQEVLEKERASQGPGA